MCTFPVYELQAAEEPRVLALEAFAIDKKSEAVIV